MIFDQLEASIIHFQTLRKLGIIQLRIFLICVSQSTVQVVNLIRFYDFCQVTLYRQRKSKSEIRKEKHLLKKLPLKIILQLLVFCLCRFSRGITDPEGKPSLSTMVCLYSRYIPETYLSGMQVVNLQREAPKRPHD